MRDRPVPCSRAPVLAGWADLDKRETATDIQERHPILIDPQFRIDPVLVTASDLEERREEERAEKIRAYCAGHGLSYERLPLFGSDRFVIDGERLAVHEVAACYLPSLFGTRQEHAQVQGRNRPASPALPQRSGYRATDGAGLPRRARSGGGRGPAASPRSTLSNAIVRITASAWSRLSGSNR